MKRAPTDIPKASKEVILEAKKLSAPAARFLIAGYYATQDARKRGDMQLRHLGDSVASELAGTVQYTADANAIIESQVQRALKAYAESTPVGRWCLAQHGIGPVISAGMIANIDVEMAQTAGAVWRFAGLDPSCKWNKGEKRPWNADLKQLCFHAGECFKRSSNHPDSFYGKLYRERKALLVERNDSGGNAERAKTFVTKSADVKATLAEGKLPDGNLDRQACNYAVKLFLSHLHAVMYWDRYKKPTPKPFAISILGHAHEIRVPHSEMFSGFDEAYYGGGQMMEAAE
jgi:hypothetical protein